MSLKTQLQTAIIAILFVSFLFIGYWSVRFISNQNDTRTKDILFEKLHSILIEIQNKVNANPAMLSDANMLESYLIKFSNIFFIDINMYKTDGRLMSSSRSTVFNEHLIADVMHKQAFDAFKKEKKSIFIQQEKLGELYYWSAYIPLRDAANNVVAFINLPYFAKQTDLQEELTAFISTYTNIYLIIMAMAIIIVLIVSGYIVRPLQMLKDRLSTLSISDHNKKISWHQNDEIGALVKAYNLMLDELKISAEKLAMTERESAWREMAQQVAHEIKNPLTPLRLSVQNLYRAWEDKSPDWEERFKRFKTMALEQIDTLSVIATEFSNFAKMPFPQKQMINLNQIINAVIHLFKEETEVPIHFHCEQEYQLYADKDQMTRVFTNLIKNSLQALDGSHSGRIDITLQHHHKSIIINVKDNGPGIHEDIQENIFKVNFTTKTTGAGLGLAMVKGIVNSHQGEIWFETSEAGTIFFIQLPLNI